jgi:hypothetical protein
MQWKGFSNSNFDSTPYLTLVFDLDTGSFPWTLWLIK